MKIKTTKQMNLWQIIKHVQENDELFHGKMELFFVSDDGRTKLVFDNSGTFQTDQWIDIDEDTFTVSTEEELTEHTVFDELHEYFWDLEDGLGITEIHTNESISGIQEEHDEETVPFSITVRRRADNEPTLIWSKDTGIPAEGVIEV